MSKSTTVPVAVIGAGPYGLSVAAHLRSRGIEPRVFGEPMDTWCQNMPSGMFLKSTPRASSLSAPVPGSSFADFCADIGAAPLDDRHAIPIDLFIRYGLWFRQRHVPDIDAQRVRRLGWGDPDFELLLASGEDLSARAVVMASGIAAFAYLPPELAMLVPEGPSPAGPVSHTSQHREFSAFSNRDIAILGGGQSALESAALLHEVGAHVHVLVRAPRVLWGNPPDESDGHLAHRLIKPPSALGPGWSLYTMSRAPGLIRHLPAPTRLRLVKSVLGPSGAWWLRDRVVDSVDVRAGTTVRNADTQAGRVRLRLTDATGASSDLEVDHVLAATGYHVDVDRIGFLAPDLAPCLDRVAGSPQLTASFESSVPGLFFTGLAAAATFGPVLRFVCGSGFTARRVSAALAERLRQRTAA